MIHSTNKKQRSGRSHMKRHQFELRITRSTGKIIMTVFRGGEGVLLGDFLPFDTTINGPYYASLLHQLRSSIREKHRRKLTHNVLLLHDNAPAHKFNQHHTGFTELNNSPYSPGIPPSDYHLFSNLKYSLRGRNFETNDEVIMTMNHYLENVDCD